MPIYQAYQEYPSVRDWVPCEDAFLHWESTAEHLYSLASEAVAGGDPEFGEELREMADFSLGMGYALLVRLN